MKMKFYSLGFFVTDDCNFDCSYCRYKKEKQTIALSTVDKAVDFFFPYLADERALVVFYGGEPLLAFDAIQHAVMLLHEKNKESRKPLQFTTTTNGSLLTDEMLDFFNRYKFTLMLSFDGLNQEKTRKPGSRESTLAMMQRLSSDSYPGIVFSCNSVFTPDTVRYLCQSLRYLVEAGGTGLRFRLAEDYPWDDGAIKTLELELRKLSDYVLSYFKTTGTIPLAEFQHKEPRHKAGNKKTSYYHCDGGYYQMAVTPGEDIWGCVQFHGYLKDKINSADYRAYSFGKLDDFIKHHDTIYPRIMKNYANLRQDFYFTEEKDCFLCPELSECSCCPVYCAYPTSLIGKIPKWRCRLRQVQANAAKRFREKLNRLTPPHKRAGTSTTDLIKSKKTIGGHYE